MGDGLPVTGDGEEGCSPNCVFEAESGDREQAKGDDCGVGEQAIEGLACSFCALFEELIVTWGTS